MANARHGTGKRARTTGALPRRSAFCWRRRGRLALAVALLAGGGFAAWRTARVQEAVSRAALRTFVQPWLRDHPRWRYTMGSDALTFASRPLRDDDLRAAASFPWIVRNLTAAYNKPEITDEGLDALTRRRSPRQLLLNAGPGVTDDGWAHLARWRSLDMVTLRDARLGPRAAETLGRLPALRELHLGSMESMTPDVWKAFGRPRTVKAVRLQNFRSLGDAALEELGQWPALRKLGIMGCGGTTSAGWVALGRSRSLRELEVGAAGGSPNAPLDADALAGLARLAKLEVLSLQSGGPFNGAELTRLTALTRLRSLTLSSLSRDDAGALELLYGLPGLESLSVAGETIDDPMMAALGSLPNLTALSVGNSPRFTGAALVRLPRPERLRSLKLSAVADPTPELFAALERLTALRELTLDHVQLNDATLAALARLKSLESLTLQNRRVRARPVTDQGAVTPIPSGEPTVAGTRITDDGLAALAALPRLESLNLADAPLVTDAGLLKLAAGKRLRFVMMRDTGATAQGQTAVKALRPDLVVNIHPFMRTVPAVPSP